MSSARHSSHTVLIFIFQTIILFLVKVGHKLDMCSLIFLCDMVRAKDFKNYIILCGLHEKGNEN